MPQAVPTVVSIARAERRRPPGRTRVPEPMAMDDAGVVKRFHAGGETPGMRGVYEVSARSLAAIVPAGGKVLDLGVGSGRALGRLLAVRPDIRATGVDLAPRMLAEAHRFLDQEGVGDRVTLIEADMTALPRALRAGSWEAVSSVWALHHLPSPVALRATLGQIARIRDRCGSAVWLLDFQRLRDPGSFPTLQEALEPDLSPMLRADAVDSEGAAFTQEELRAELDAGGLGELESGLLRPVPWLQAFWSRARNDAGGSAEMPQSRAPLSSPAGEVTERLRRGFSRLPF